MSVKQRFHYIDALRVGALFLIILYHFETDIITSGLFDLVAVGIRYETANIHMAKIGVTLFFMVSGFGLMYSSRDSFSIKEFAKKRILRIYLPFYVVSLLVFLSKWIMTSGKVFDEGIPAWHIIYTLLGLDGYLAEYGIATFSLGVGEWFVGCMVGMYICFPLLRWGMKKNAGATILLATCYYIIIVMNYQGVVPAHYFFFIKIYDFILGMYLAVRLGKANCVKNEKSGWIAIALFVMILLVLRLPVTIPLKPEYVHPVFCALVFVCGFWLERVTVVQRIFASEPVQRLSKYSYEMFLIHHWGLIMMNRVLKPQSLVMIFVCFVVEFAVIFVGGLVLKEGLDRAIRKIQVIGERKS